MKKIIQVFILVTAFSSTSIQAQNWTPSTGSVMFSLKMLGATVEGKLGGIRANLTFQNNQPTAIFASVDSRTIDTDNNLRDSHLKGKADFFEPEKYPTITMNSKGISKTTKGYEGIFDITIKGIKKAIKVPFTFIENGPNGVFKSQFIIDRNDWKFGGNTIGMGDNVKVNITLNVKK
jgi:polyisoprenoid-binding protein YceI